MPKHIQKQPKYSLLTTKSLFTNLWDILLIRKLQTIIRGINGTELVELILKYYDQLSEKYRKMIPLKMVYIPVPVEE